MADAGNRARSAGRGRGRSRSKSASRPGDQGGADSALGESIDRSTIDSRPALTLAGPVGRGRPTRSTVSKPGGASIGSDVSTTSKMSNESVDLAKRPGFGQSGRAIQLKANCFTVKINRDLNVYQYRIDITQADGYNRKINREECFSIFWSAAKAKNWTSDPYTILYDGGGSCFTLNKLSIEIDQAGRYRTEFDHSMPRSGRKKYAISISLTGLKNISFTSGDSKTTLFAVTVLDLIFRQYYNFPSEKKTPFDPFGRSFFHRPPNYDRTCFELDSGREVWGGYYYAAAVGIEFVPILNIDVANGIFLKNESVLQFMCDALNGVAGSNKYRLDQLEALTQPYYLKPVEIAAFNKAIRGYCVICQTTPHRHQKVLQVTDHTALNLTFDLKDGSSTRKINVVQYFQEKHKIQLRHPYFPCLQVGTKTKFAYLPLELCKIMSPQKVRGKLTDTQTATMIRGVCTDAVERERRINEVIEKAGLQSDPFAQKFGVSLNTRMIQVQGRVLGAPQLEYAGNFKAVPRDGSWTMTPQTRLYVPTEISSYGVISFISKNAEGDLADFCGHVMDQARRLGMRVESLMPDSVAYYDENQTVDFRKAIEFALAECTKNSKGKTCNLIIVPTYVRKTEIYAGIKSCAEKEFGLATQFILQKTIRQSNKPQTWSNIVLKINAKLGGINCKLVTDNISKKYLIDQATLIMGLDVTHPGPTDKKTPSIGAAVGNIDTIPGKFGANAVVQKHRREEVLYLINAIRDRIDAFFKQTGRRPERIIMYRDGVAEGQFAKVLKEEMKGVALGLECCGEGGETKVTYVVVQKRHHVRFFCSDARDQCGKAKNIPPGTAVDSVITDPQLYDFYLCSHFGIQGTSRPTHYHVLKDDNNFSQDELQALTYYLCHLYARCTRSVSIPAPCYYAHLVCDRARHHLNNIIGDENDDKMSDTSSNKSGSDDATEEQLSKAVIVCENLMTRMYFC